MRGIKVYHLRLQVADFLEAPLTAWACLLALSLHPGEDKSPKPKKKGKGKHKVAEVLSATLPVWSQLDDLSEAVVAAVMSSSAALLAPLCTRLRTAPSQHHASVILGALTSKPEPKPVDVVLENTSLTALPDSADFEVPGLLQGLQASWQDLSACDPTCEALGDITWLHLTLPESEELPTTPAVNAAAAAVLRGCTALRDLTITGSHYYNQPTAATAVFQELTALQALDTLRIELVVVSFTADRCAVLWTALLQLPGLRVLHLPCCGQASGSESAAAILHKIQMLAWNCACLPSLEHLCLPELVRCHGRERETFSRLQFTPLYLPRLRSATLSTSAFLPDASRALLAGCSDLRSLRIHGHRTCAPPADIPSLTAALAGLEANSLRMLVIEETGMYASEDEAAALGAAIAAQTALTALRLFKPLNRRSWESGGAITAHIVPPLLACTALQWLQLDLLNSSRGDDWDASSTGAQALSSLAQLPRLTHLELVLGAVTVPLVAQLLHYPALGTLSLRLPSWFKEALLLRSITVSDIIPWRDREAGPGLRSAWDAQQSEASPENLSTDESDVLAALQRAGSLAVEVQPVPWGDAPAVEHALLQLPQLRDLKLQGFLNPDLGAADQLPTLSASLTALDVSGISIRVRECSVTSLAKRRTEAAHDLSAALAALLQTAALPHLRRLDASLGHLDAVDVDAIASAAARLPALSHLILHARTSEGWECCNTCGCEHHLLAKGTFGDVGAAVLAQRLPACAALERLDVAGQHCSAAALAQLQRALPAVFIEH